MKGVTLHYNAKLAGNELLARNDGARYLTNLSFWEDRNIYGAILGSASKGDYAYLTGYYFVDANNDEILFQTTFGVYLVVDNNVDDVEKWEWTPGTHTTRLVTNSDDKAKDLVQKIIENNKIIIANNLLCARYANKFTAKQQQQIRELQQRLQARNEALQAEGVTTDVKTSYPEGYADLGGYLSKLMSGGGVGISTVAIIVISATIVAGMGIFAYYTYKKLYDESEQDVKYSKQLTKILTSKLTEEEYQQLLNETKGIVTKARIKQGLSSYGNVLKWGAIAVAGFFAIRAIKENM